MVPAVPAHANTRDKFVSTLLWSLWAGPTEKQDTYVLKTKRNPSMKCRSLVQYRRVHAKNSRSADCTSPWSYWVRPSAKQDTYVLKNKRNPSKKCQYLVQYSPAHAQNSRLADCASPWLSDQSKRMSWTRIRLRTGLSCISRIQIRRRSNHYRRIII